MAARVSSFFVFAAALGGCSVSAITSLHETFPNEKNLVQACRKYDGGHFNSIAKDIASKQKAGWKVKLTGYDHWDVFGMLWAKIWVCYERPAAASKSTAIAAETP